MTGERWGALNSSMSAFQGAFKVPDSIKKSLTLGSFWMLDIHYILHPNCGRHFSEISWVQEARVSLLQGLVNCQLHSDGLESESSVLTMCHDLFLIYYNFEGWRAARVHFRMRKGKEREEGGKRMEESKDCLDKVCRCYLANCFWFSVFFWSYLHLEICVALANWWWITNKNRIFLHLFMKILWNAYELLYFLIKIGTKVSLNVFEYWVFYIYFEVVVQFL